MSGTQGTGHQAMPNPGVWINQDGTPTVTFMVLMQSLWSRTGGTQAPVYNGQQGLNAVDAQVVALSAEVGNLEGTAFGFFEVPDNVDLGGFAGVDLLFGQEVPDSPANPVGTVTVVFGAGTAGFGDTFWTAPVGCQIVGVTGRLNVTNGGAGTLVPVKVSSGTPVSSGSPLTSSSMNLAGTAQTNQPLGLSGTLSLLALAAGDSLGLAGTGSILAATGSLTISFIPL